MNMDELLGTMQWAAVGFSAVALAGSYAVTLGAAFQRGRIMSTMEIMRQKNELEHRVVELARRWIYVAKPKTLEENDLAFAVMRLDHFLEHAAKRTEAQH